MVTHCGKRGRSLLKGHRGRGRQLAKVLKHCGLDLLKLSACVGILHITDHNAELVRVHVVVVLLEGFVRNPANPQ